jgi:uncharacterized membrane protein
VTWSVSFRLRRYLRESLWVVPLVGGVLGWVLGLASSDLGAVVDLGTRWQYSATTAESVLAAVVAASVGLVGFVVTVSVLIVQMATGTFSARYMRIFYRDWAFKAVGQTDLSDRGVPVGDMDSGLVIPVRRWADYLTLSVTEIREYGDTSIQVVRRLRAMLEELAESVLPERREAVLEELARLDAAVTEEWAGTVDFDLAGLSDRQGIGGPSARGTTG